LDDHGLDVSCADPLAETGITIAALDSLAERVSGEALNSAVAWIAAGCGLRSLAYEIDMATSRIQQLVSSVKGFTFMDHAPTPEPLDIRGGIQDTFTMLAAKKRAKGVNVVLNLPDTLPRVMGVGGELNQVWMNLVDNALDAVAPGGTVSVETSLNLGKLTVCITDDGPGIPADIQGRIFDPFFTTKDVGKGTGLGLDIVRRIIQRHDGTIDLESRPGRTQFRVGLPTA
jgi:signal transduction histidine kinase